MKKIILAFIIIAIVLIMTACNKQIIDVTFRFNRAIIALPNGQVVEGEVDSWTDFEDGDQLQIKINGATYLTHSANVVLISD